MYTSYIRKSEARLLLHLLNDSMTFFHFFHYFICLAWLWPNSPGLCHAISNAAQQVISPKTCRLNHTNGIYLTRLNTTLVVAGGAKFKQKLKITLRYKQWKGNAGGKNGEVTENSKSR